MYYPYFKQKRLLSIKEADFYEELKVKAEEKGLVVFAKVRLADLVGTPNKLKYFNLFFSRIKGKHIDFVLCDATTYEIRCLVELDDKSHDLPQRHSIDVFKNEVIKNAGHNFIRCRVSSEVCEIL